MLEILTGTGLAAAAGLNAYIPLLALGLAGRFLDFVELPAAWSWLSNEWVLGVLAVLLIVEFIADKIPAVDTVNDWLQTAVRPAAGGIVFGTGAGAETAAVSDPSAFFEGDQWVPVVIGLLIALAVHLAKMLIRPALNAVTAGVAAPVASTAEDFSSVVLTVLAILAPVFVILAIVGLIVGAVFAVRGLARRRARAATTAA